MTPLVAALPMYDWPERRADVDSQWVTIRDLLRADGIDAPERLARCNADLPAVPGGIRDMAGNLIAPDPATLPADEFDLGVLWRHPALLLAQTCWGPMLDAGLEPHVVVVGQQDYAGVGGGEGSFYSSAIVMRADHEASADVEAPPDGSASLPIERLRAARFAFNDRHSRSGLLGLEADLVAAGEGMSMFSEAVETGGHRASMRFVAEERADVAAIDCLSWALAKRFEPAAKSLRVAGWTARRLGLPYVTSAHVVHRIRQALIGALPVQPK